MAKHLSIPRAMITVYCLHTGLKHVENIGFFLQGPFLSETPSTGLPCPVDGALYKC